MGIALKLEHQSEVHGRSPGILIQNAVGVGSVAKAIGEEAVGDLRQLQIAGVAVVGDGGVVNNVVRIEGSRITLRGQGQGNRTGQSHGSVVGGSSVSGDGGNGIIATLDAVPDFIGVSH